MPAGPATFICSCGYAFTASRSASVIPPTAGSPSDSLSAAAVLSSGIEISTAMPSCEGIGAIIATSAKSARVLPGSIWIDGACSMNEPIAAMSVPSSFAPSGRVTTIKAGIVVVSENFSSSSATSVDSADAGRKEALSFFCTSLSFPARGPATLPITSHAMATAMAIQTAIRPVLTRELVLGDVTGALMRTGSQTKGLLSS